MSFTFSEKSQTLTVTHLDHQTGEFVGEGQVLIPPMTGLPAHCTMSALPAEKTGFARVFSEETQRWTYEEDHRGQTVWDKATAFPHLVTALGPLPENMTETAPVANYSRWNGTGWEEDVQAARAAQALDNRSKKITLTDEAARRMMPLQNAVKLGMATDDEKALLTEWETYTVLLSRVDPDAEGAFSWPEPPLH